MAKKASPEGEDHATVNRRMLSNLFLLFITFVWGATFTLTKDALVDVRVYPFLSVRFLLATVALACICCTSARRRKAFTYRTWRVGIGLGLLLFGGYALQTLGLVTVSPSVTGFITGLNVVLVPIFAIPVLRKIPHLRTWLGAVLAVIGLALISGGGFLHLAPGDLEVLACALCLALQILFVERFGATEDALALATVELLVVTVCAMLASLWHPVPGDWAPSVWLRPAVVWAILINGLLGTSLAYWGQNVCQKFTSSTEIAIIFSMEPVFAAIIAWLALGDALTVLGILGGALIFVSMWTADPTVRLPLRRRQVARTRG